MPAAYLQNEAELDTLLKAESAFVMDCTAPWCGPCKVVAPLIDKLADEYSDRAKVMKVNLDDNQGIAKRFGIRSIPAVIFFSNGEVAETIVGKKSYEEYSGALEKYLA